MHFFNVIFNQFGCFAAFHMRNDNTKARKKTEKIASVCAWKAE